MTTTFVINSICDHDVKITASLNGSIIEVELESTCKKIRDYASLINKLAIREIAREILNNPIYIKASESRIDPNCLVPCGVAFCTWTEAGMVSKNLLSRMPAQCIVFKYG
ncbi:MAG: hypothetical protein N3D12_01995 [Candidatus Methanomethyliaceae archaeon]|nr:hypothetical protein [Candidatus Methanomethyliaceae archaeon]